MRPRKKPSRSVHRPKFEALEARRLPAIVTYQGGPLIDHVAVETIYLGTAWTDNSALRQDSQRLDQFFASLTNSSYLDMLNEYSTPQGGQIGRGSFTGRVNLPEDTWTASVLTDETIQHLLDSELAARVIPPPNGNQLLFVFTPPNVAIYKSGEASNGQPVAFAGYHDTFVDSAGQTVYYAVIPNPVGNARVSGLSTADQETTAASHEMAEAITDPTFHSWWDDSGDETTGLEIADFANPSTDTVYLGPYAVERVWSNRLHGLETPAGATTTPSGSVPAGSPGGTNQTVPPIPPDLSHVASQFTQVLGYDAAFISSDYERFLGRSADDDGMNYWISQMQAGMPANVVDAAFLSSPEAIWHDGGTDAGFVAGLYHKLLERAPDAAGNQFWLAQLQAGESKYDVAFGFAASLEHQAMLVTADYEKLLGRAPTTADVAYWLPRIETSPSDAALAASLIGSPEYYNNSTKGHGVAAAWVTSVYQDLFSMSPPVGEAGWWISQLQTNS